VEETTEAQRAIVAVSADAAAELEREGLVDRLPAFRGLEAVFAVGADAATLVTLLQTPDAIRAFATWLRARCARTSTSVDIIIKRDHKTIHVQSEGVSIESLTDFITAAFEEDDTNG
jgi:hypothetical protein